MMMMKWGFRETSPSHHNEEEKMMGGVRNVRCAALGWCGTLLTVALQSSPTHMNVTQALTPMSTQDQTQFSEDACLEGDS